MKVKYFVIFVSLITFFFSCKEEYQPELSDEKMIDILVDLHVAEAASMSLGKELKDSLINVYYPQIFEMNAVKDSVFFKDFEELRKNPKKLEMIYQRVYEDVEQLGSDRMEGDSLKKK